MLDLSRLPGWIAVVLGLMAGLASPAFAADPWNIPHEKVVTLKGRIVDIACHLKRDCPENCGGGRRQLGVLLSDGRLRMVAKGNIDFAGAVLDLLPFCGKEVELDGLLIENPAVTLFFAQRVRAAPQTEFTPTDAFLRDWTARNGAADEWWRKDPAARKLIEADGPFGIKGLTPPPKLQ